MKYFFLNIIVLGIFTLTFAIAQPKLEIVGGDTHNWNKVSPKE